MNKIGGSERSKPASAAAIVDSRVRNRKARLIKATERVYCGNCYSVSNAMYVITEKSVVVIDTTEGISAARASLADFRKITELPVSWIVYTHFHGDHIRGAKAFHGTGVKIIAQRRMPEDLARNNMLLPYRERVNAIQLGTPSAVGQRYLGLERSRRRLRASRHALRRGIPFRGRRDAIRAVSHAGRERRSSHGLDAA